MDSTRETDEMDPRAVFDEGTAVDEAMRKAWYHAVRRHRRLGIPLIMGEDGKVVRLDPHEVELPEGERPEDSPEDELPGDYA